MIDEQYYQVATPDSIAEKVVIAARDRIYADFIRHCKPATNSTIADVGVSDTVTDAANVLERLYPHPDRIAAFGLGTGDAFKASYPAVAYRQIQAHEPLPVPDQSFDIATANAVLEHVGSHEAQRDFVHEMFRISKQTYITVPHRYFPVEHHTGIPFLHYNTTTFRAACALTGRSEWAREENLILMTKRRLAALVPHGARATIGFTGIALGPLSSNLFMHLTRDL